MDEEKRNDDERREMNMSSDRFGHGLPCPICEGQDVELQVMLWRYGDQYVPGLPAEDCGYWLEYDCIDCEFYSGMVLVS